jgi:hypothetical protein
MAATTQPEGPLTPEPFVERVQSDPNEPSNVVVVFGYLGKSSSPQRWRLHRSPALTDYVEVAEDDIIHSERVEKPGFPLPGTMLWVKKGATVAQVRFGEARAAPDLTALAGLAGQADFLQGEILQSLIGLERPPADGGRGTIIITIATLTILTIIATGTTPVTVTGTLTASPPTVFEEQ